MIYPFDWLVKRFHKENIVDLFKSLFKKLFISYKKFLADFIYVYLANFYLKCHEAKILTKIKRSLHELLGWFFGLSTRLALPLFKIARLIVLWHYGCASVYIEIDIIFIFLQKIFNSLYSVDKNLIIALTIGKRCLFARFISLKLVFI